MRVLVTGGSGRLGRWVVRELAEHGHLVVNADRRRPEGGDDGGESAVHYREVELTDVGQVAGAMAGCDGVVHLGAIAGAYTQPDEVVFGANTRATFAVLRAAMLVGVHRAVIASSGSALGMAWAVPPFPPLYAPVDEAHPLLAQDPYGLSKEVDERTGAMFARRTGMSVLALRFLWIAEPGEAGLEAATVARDPRPRSFELWGYVDVRDAARACRLAVEREGLGFEAVNIAAADTLAERPTEALMRDFCPTVELRRPIAGTAGAWSIEKARGLIGYEPRHSWRTERA